MSDIVERLRGFAASWHRSTSGPMGWLRFPEHYEEAADEIERLHAEVARLQNVIADHVAREAERMADRQGTQVMDTIKSLLESGVITMETRVLGTLPILASGEIVGNHATVWAADPCEVFSMRIDNIGATDCEESDAFFEACELYSTREAAQAACAAQAATKEPA